MLAEQISDDLQLPIDYIHTVAKTASHRYKTYEIMKKAGGVRTIHHPARELKTMQRWLVSHVINHLPVHQAAAAYRPGIGIASNAAVHQKSRFLLRIDFEDFFPSLTAGDIRSYVLDNQDHVKDWDDDDVAFFCATACRWDCLTIGAPSSPGIANALCMQLDTRLTEFCKSKSVRYTRYADDLFFSARKSGVLLAVESRLGKVVKALDWPKGLKVNRKKTAHVSKRGRRIVTGLILTSDGAVSVGRKRKRTIRSWIHQLEKLRPKERRRLAGMLAFVKSVEPTFINRIIVKYGAERVGEAMRMEVDS